MSVARVRTAVAAFAVLATLAASAQAHAAPTKQECIDSNESAQGLQHAGKPREARSKLLACVAESCPGPVRDDCRKRLADVERATPSIIFAVNDAGGAALTAVRVSVDGAPVSDRVDGTPISVDPGEHTFRFEAAGLGAVEKTLVLREAEKGRQETVVLGARAAAGTGGVTQRTVGLIVGGAGVGIVIIGGVLALVAKSTYDGALRDHCGGNPAACDAAGVQGGASAHDQATAATVAFVVGAASLAAGAVLFITAPRSGVAIHPSVGTNYGGVDLRVSW